MIPIAHPLASENSSKVILELTEKTQSTGKLIHGIKACQKAILRDGCEGSVLVLNALTSPMDLITHLPIVCENRKIPYLFVESSRWINGFTCVLLPAGGEAINEIREVLSK